MIVIEYLHELHSCLKTLFKGLICQILYKLVKWFGCCH